jgi:hypothetical protein
VCFGIDHTSRDARKRRGECLCPQAIHRIVGDIEHGLKKAGWANRNVLTRYTHIEEGTAEERHSAEPGYQHLRPRYGSTTRAKVPPKEAAEREGGKSSGEVKSDIEHCWDSCQCASRRITIAGKKLSYPDQPAQQANKIQPILPMS